MPLKPTIKIKKKIRVLLIISARLLSYADACLCIAVLIAFLDAIKDKTDESQFSAGERSQNDAVNTWYATVDTADDPDNYDPCATATLPSGFAGNAENL